MNGDVRWCGYSSRFLASDFVPPPLLSKRLAPPTPLTFFVFPPSLCVTSGGQRVRIPPGDAPVDTMCVYNIYICRQRRAIKARARFLIAFTPHRQPIGRDEWRVVTADDATDVTTITQQSRPILLTGRPSKILSYPAARELHFRYQYIYQLSLFIYRIAYSFDVPYSFYRIGIL